MFDDYVLYRIEALHSQERMSDFMRIVRGVELEGEYTEELILPDSKALKDNMMPLTTLSPHCPLPGNVYQNRMSVITTANTGGGVTVNSVLADMQGHSDYDSQQDGYTTDESGSLEQIPSPRGSGLDISRIPMTTTTQQSAGVSGFNHAYSADYGDHFKQMHGGNNMAQPHSFHTMSAAAHMVTAGMENQGREAMIAQQQQTGNRVTGNEWNVSQQPRQQQGMMGDPHNGLRGSDAMTYNYNNTLRHNAYDANTYQYDVNSGMAGNMYQGFGGVNDAFMTSGMGNDANKRRFEDDQYMRSCKRANKEQFFFEPTFTNIG